MRLRATACRCFPAARGVPSIGGEAIATSIVAAVPEDLAAVAIDLDLVDQHRIAAIGVDAHGGDDVGRAGFHLGSATAGSILQLLPVERGRLMQEMHDGIGSNLITALAVARQQNQPDTTIKTLSRALADLKITVDSLEPVEGDLVALIANLRHRMAGDLRDAGIGCKWEVQPCDPLPWLDAANALHVLRIFQEAIGNVLAHAGATEIRIGCREDQRERIAGVAAYVADNGHGSIDMASRQSGKGIANMKARASSLHGHLDCEACPGEGTLILLWLPYVRTMARQGA